MSVSSTLTPILDRPQWERSHAIPNYQKYSYFFEPYKAFINKGSGSVLYCEEDSYILVRNYVNNNSSDNPNMTVHHPYGPSGTAVSGTTSSITTSFNLRTDARGYKIYIFEGPGAGDERVIAKNVVGNLLPTSGTIYVTEPFSEPITNASKFLLYTGTYYAGDTRSAVAYWFAKYDPLLDTETLITSQVFNVQVSGPIKSYSQTQLQTITNLDICYVSASVTSATTSSITTSGKNWSVNNFLGYEVRIVSGTGKGQFRTITSSISDTLYVDPWTTQPDSTSYYVIKPNGRFIYILQANIKRPDESIIYGVFSHLYDVLTNTFKIQTSYSQAYSYEDRVAPGNNIFYKFVDNHPDPEWNDENNLLNGKTMVTFNNTHELYAGVNLLPGVYFYDVFKNYKTFRSWVKPFYLSRSNTIRNVHYDGRKTFYLIEVFNTVDSLSWYFQDAYNRIYKMDINNDYKIDIKIISTQPRGILATTSEPVSRGFNLLNVFESDDGIQYLNHSSSIPTDYTFRMLLRD